MSDYRLWYVKRGERQQGPFPEPLICRHIILGRIGEQDVLSLDGNFWRGLDQWPELLAAVDQMLNLPQSESESAADEGVDWRDERTKAALRWMDDRKSPDPRNRGAGGAANGNRERRTGRDRRANPETVESHVYRESRASFEEWIRSRRPHYGSALAGLAVVGLLVLAAVSWMRPVNPVSVDLRVGQADCAATPAPGVNWRGCDKSQHLLVGVDLRGADLSGANFRKANLRYADLRQARLLQADVDGADLTGAKLDGAVWHDGRVCADNSIGACR